MLGDVEDVVVGDVLRRLDWGCGGPWRCLFGCRLCVLRGDSGVASDAVEVLGCADSDVASEPETSRVARDAGGVGVL